MEIVVVDNGSQDGSVEAIREKFPAVQLICNTKNLGTAVAENQGMEYALENGADYIGILNNDTTFSPSMFQELVKAIQADEHIAVVGPKVYYYDEPDVIWAAGAVVDFGETVTKMRGTDEQDLGQYDTAVDVDYIPSCALIAKASAVQKVGLLDPVYFTYFDDPDWCARMRQHNYRIRYVPTAVMWHKVARTSGGSYAPAARYASGINAVVYMKKYAKWHQWIKWFVFAVLSLPIVYLVRAFQGTHKSVWAKAMGIRDGFRGVRVTAETFQRR
jgi:GT2 family glycosyltransferase